MKRFAFLLFAGLAIGAIAAPPSSHAQAQAPAPAPAFTQEQLDQLLAPIALYPDALLAQILMAATYPLQVVEAARWVKANPQVKGKALEDAMQQQAWDPAVKSLTAFPQVLDMMNQKLDLTQKLGDAVLSQQQQVMATVQSLRAKAQAAGTLKSSEQQKVTSTQSGSSTVIVVEPANPEIVYVPTYNPTVVYGAWPYPASPPYAYYPPGYVASNLISFGVGLAVGSALWGGCDWGRGDVNVNVNRYNNFNRTNISNNNWQHNAANRKGVPYRDQSVAQRYDRGGASARDAQSREAFRGRDGGAAQLPARDGAGQQRPGGAGQQQRPGASRDAAADRQRQGGRDNAAQGGNRGAALQGVGDGGRTRDASNRGNASRESMNASRGSKGGGGGAAAARSGGGGGGGGAAARGGGGGGGGGRGGGGGGGGGGRGR